MLRLSSARSDSRDSPSFEDMDAKRGAQRFVNYWDTRRKLLGPDKFLLPMKLSEALRDDLDAIEDGVFIILLHVDMSGRIINFAELHRRSEGRYSSQSLVRSQCSFCFADSSIP